MRYPGLGQLGHVHQAFNTVLDARKRSEVGKLGHAADNQLVDFVFCIHPAPRLGLGAFDRQGNLAFLGIDAQDKHIDFLTDLEHFTRVPHAAP